MELILLLLLLLLEALQLQRSFGLLKEFLPFGPTILIYRSLKILSLARTQMVGRLLNNELEMTWKLTKNSTDNPAP